MLGVILVRTAHLHQLINFYIISPHGLLETLYVPSHLFIGFKDLGDDCRGLTQLILRALVIFGGWLLCQRILALNDCEPVAIEFGGAWILTQNLLLSVSLRERVGLHSRCLNGIERFLRLIVDALSLREFTGRIDQRESLCLLDLSRSVRIGG